LWTGFIFAADLIANAFVGVSLLEFMIRIKFMGGDYLNESYNMSKN